jgi:SRSO17 transposase
VAYRLYLPQEWAQDLKRKRKVGVPEEIVFKTKPQIAFDQIREAWEAGLAARDRADGCWLRRQH